MRQDMQSKKQIFGKLLKAQVVGAVALWLLTLGSYKAYAADTEWQFNYTGHEETWTVPEDGLYYFEVAGASGGGARDTGIPMPQAANYKMYRWNQGHTAKAWYDARVEYQAGGYGALLTGQYRLQKGTVLYINIGEQGTVRQSNGTGGQRTYNGGGAAGGTGAGSGGGATSIQTSSGTVSNSNAVKNALFIAGGGGAIWSEPFGNKQALEYPDPSNLNNSLHVFGAGNAALDNTGNDLNADDQLSASKQTSGEDGKFILAMWPGTQVQNARNVRKQISGSDIGATRLMTDAYSGGGGGGYIGGNDGAISDSVGSNGGASYFGVDKLRKDSIGAQDKSGSNIDGQIQKAKIGNGYITIRKQTDYKQTLTIYLQGYASQNGQHQITVQGLKGTQVNINNIVWQSGYNCTGYEILNDDKILNGQLNNKAFETSSQSQNSQATYTFGWDDDSIQLKYNAKLQIKTKVIEDQTTKNKYVEATFKLNPSSTGKIFKIYSKEGDGQYNQLTDGQFSGGTQTTGKTYGYTGTVQQFTAQQSGIYRFNMAGGGGGNWEGNRGDGGGTGIVDITMQKGQTLYISVGGFGTNNHGGDWTQRFQYNDSNGWNVSGDQQWPGGWNGGGAGGTWGSDGYTVQKWGASGGGATQIQSQLVGGGQLSEYSSNRDKVIAVVGGGAGGSGAAEGANRLPTGGAPGSLNSTQSGEVAAGQNKRPYCVLDYYNHTINSDGGFSREIQGSFGKGADAGATRKHRICLDQYDKRAWQGAEANPGGGGGYTGGWAYDSNGPGTDANAGSGSAYVNRSLISSTAASNLSTTSNSNGQVIMSVVSQYVDSGEMKAYFYDKVAPNTPQNLVTDRQTSGVSTISWNNTLDNGSDYMVKVERYANATDTNYVDKLEQQLYVETGVAKYIYRIDDNSTTQVNNSNKTGEVTATEVVNIQNSNDGKWFHVAAVDGAGNIGGSAHIKIPSEFIIHYDKNAVTATGTMADQKIQSGTTGTILENKFNRIKYTFINWTTKSNGTGDTYVPGDKLSYYDAVVTKNYGQEITLYAQWQPIYTLYVKPNGGLWQGSNQIKTFDMLHDDILQIMDATRLGYNFKGWSINMDN